MTVAESVVAEREKILEIHTIMTEAARIEREARKLEAIADTFPKDISKDDDAYKKIAYQLMDYLEQLESLDYLLTVKLENYEKTPTSNGGVFQETPPILH